MSQVEKCYDRESVFSRSEQPTHEIKTNRKKDKPEPSRLPPEGGIHCRLTPKGIVFIVGEQERGGPQGIPVRQ